MYKRTSRMKCHSPRTTTCSFSLHGTLLGILVERVRLVTDVRLDLRYLGEKLVETSG